jgi:NADPH:quinone reductase-like Zn-dependent oxidoreductase
MGADGSGTIAAVGSHVTKFHVGDRVYSYSYGNRSGGFYAQYVSVPSDRVAPVPAHMEMKIARAMPCIALTAQSGLETLKATRGQTVLVFGASGGVGSCAVWLGSEKGATIVGTARPDAQEYVRSLGAAHTVDPNSPEPEGVIKRTAKDGFDAALVTANSDALAYFFSHLKPKAPIAFPNGVEPKPHINGHTVSAFDGAMSHEAFEKLNAAIGTRTLPLKTHVFSFKDVAAAHHRIEEGHVVGKIVLHIDL